jgi:hypothetical protein
MADVDIYLRGHNEASGAIKQVSSDLGGLDGGARNIATSMNTANGAIAALGGVASMIGVGFAATTLVNFTKDVTMMASAAEESTNKMRVVFGTASDSIEKFSRSAAQDLGMSRQQAIEAAGTFGNLFTSMGLGQGEAARMSQGIVQLAADLGSFNNIPIDVMLEKLRSGMVGEVEPLRAVGINLSAAAVSAKALELGLADANGKVDQAGLLQARYALALEQSKNAQGDFARTSDGLANSLKIAEGEVANIKVQLGELTIRPYTVVVHVVSEGLSEVNKILSTTPEQQRVAMDDTKLRSAVGALRAAEEGLRQANIQGQYLGGTTKEWEAEVKRAQAAVDAANVSIANTNAAIRRNTTDTIAWQDRLWGAADAAYAVKAAIDNSNRAPDAPAYGTGTDFAAQLLASQTANEVVIKQTAQEVQKAYDDSITEAERLATANENAAKASRSAWESAFEAIANSAESESSKAQDQLKKLLPDLNVGGLGNNKPGNNGPFEDIFRAADVAKLGQASPWAEQIAKQLGVDPSEVQAKAQETVTAFAQGFRTPEVRKLINEAMLVDQVQQAEAAKASLDSWGKEIAKEAGVNVNLKSSGTAMFDATFGSITAKNNKGTSPVDTSAEKTVSAFAGAVGSQVKVEGFVTKMGGYGETIWGYTEAGMIKKAKASVAFQAAIDAMVASAIAGALQ